MNLDYTHVGWLVLGLAALFTCANQGRAFFKGFNEEPPQLYATKVELRELKEEIADRLSDLNREVHDLRAAWNGEAKTINERLTSLIASVASLQGRFSNHS